MFVTLEGAACPSLPTALQPLLTKSYSSCRHYCGKRMTHMNNWQTQQHPGNNKLKKIPPTINHTEFTTPKLKLFDKCLSKSGAIVFLIGSVINSFFQRKKKAITIYCKGPIGLPCAFKCKYNLKQLNS